MHCKGPGKGKAMAGNADAAANGTPGETGQPVGPGNTIRAVTYVSP